MSAQKPHERRVVTAVRFPEEIHNALLEAADERDVSINYLVNKAVEYFLPRLIPADELTLVRGSVGVQETPT
jgi:predicted HicB family RNase H-like nuclease